MAFPEYVPTRVVTVGGAMSVENADSLLRVAVEIRSSHSLIWDATGYRFEKTGKAAVGELGTEVSVILPRTDVAGWKDAATGSVIDVSVPDSYSHRYTAVIRFIDQNGRTIGTTYTVGPFVLPAGTGAVDLDKMVPASSIPGGQVSIPDVWGQMVAAAEAAATAAEAALIDSAQFVADEIGTPGTPANVTLSNTIAGGVASQAPAIASARIAIERPRRTRTVWAVGDSNTVGAASGGGGITYDSTLFSSIGQPNLQYQGGSWLTWALINSDCRWTVGGVFATASWTAAQILATHVPAVIAAASPGDTVAVLAGTNGNVLADVIAIHNTLRAAGLYTVAMTIPPSSSSTLAAVARVNAGITEYAEANDIPLVDLHGAVVDPATGAYLSAYNGDGVHPNHAGAQRFGQAAAAVINSLFPTRVPLIQHNAAFVGQLVDKPLAIGAVLTDGINNMATIGSGTLGVKSDSDFLGGSAYEMTRVGTNLEAKYDNWTLAAGRRIRLGLAFKTSGSGYWGWRLESNTTGQKILFGMGYPGLLRPQQNLTRFFVEFVVPTLPDYTYRFHLSLTTNDGSLITGEVTALDLTALGL